RGRRQPHHRPGRRGPDDPLPPVRGQGRAGRGRHRAVEHPVARTAGGRRGGPMARAGGDPWDRFDGLWDELEAWFAEDGFRGSFVANAATELRSEPDHPAQAKIVQHRQARRQLLEDLAKISGAYDPAVLAAQLQVLIDGAISAAAVDRDPTAARGARGLAKAAIAAAADAE